MTDKKVSVIIPVYNTANYLPECLDSVLNQTLREIEIIVVVDASPDHSMDVVRDYEKKDDRIEILDKRVNEGLPAARNSGVAVSSGEYVIHLDSDDFWTDNNMLRELYETATIEGCDVLRFNGHEYEDGELTSTITNNLDLISGRFDKDKELWCYRSVFLYFFRRKFLHGTQLSFINGICLGEDGIFLSSALVAAQRVSSIGRCYYAYRIRPSSMMKRPWAIDQFIEEETASQIIVKNISTNRDALNDYLSYRIYVYWMAVMSAKVWRDLSKSERMRLYEFARENVLKLEMGAGRAKLRHMGGRLLHRYFLSAEFRKLDRVVCVARFLAVFLPLIKRISAGILRRLRIFRRVKRKLSGLLPTGALCALLAREKAFHNIEMLDEYNFTLPSRCKTSGVSAMLRVKNEERRIQACLESIIDVFDEIVVVDNGSDDSTLEKVNALMGCEKYANKLKVFSYPHRVARCGQEHVATPANSVNSLAYYYNWCLSKCSCSVVCKWDADMLFSSAAEAGFRSFLSGFVKMNRWALGNFPVQTVYFDDENRAYRVEGDVNEEIRVFPNSSLACFKKGDLWEVLAPRICMPVLFLTEVCVCEIKDVADDEFSHWSTTTFKNTRKVREYRNYMRVKNNFHKDNAGEFVPVTTEGNDLR